LSFMKKDRASGPRGSRIKIPMSFVKSLDLDKSHVVRVNQGKRNLSIESAATVVDLFKANGQAVSIFDVLPFLNKFKPYFCQGCEKA
jgi:hypothetical protein